MGCATGFGKAYDAVTPGEVGACHPLVRLEGFGGGKGGSYALFAFGL